MNKFDEMLKELGDLHKKSNSMDFSHHEVGVQFMDFTNKHYSDFRTALTQAAEIERGDKVVVDRGIQEVSWYMDYSENKPFLVRELNPHHFIVIQNYKILQASIESPAEETVYHKVFDNKDDALFHCKCKCAEHLYKAMITASEGK